MARVTAVFKPSLYPGAPDDTLRRELDELFQGLLPGSPDPEIDRRHAGLAIAAQNPRLALGLAKLSGFIAGELPWCRRKDLRELAIQTVNLHFKSEYSFNARVPNAIAAGIDAEQQAALHSWRTSTSFTEEQRLVIEYADAAVRGEVADELFSRLVDAHGEKEAIECTTVIAFWSFWAIFLKATHPEVRSEESA